MAQADDFGRKVLLALQDIARRLGRIEKQLYVVEARLEGIESMQDYEVGLAEEAADAAEDARTIAEQIDVPPDLQKLFGAPGKKRD